MDHAKLLDVLTSLPVSQSILPRALCFATSRPANHAICSFFDSSGYASGPIRRCLFIDYIIILLIFISIVIINSLHAELFHASVIVCLFLHNELFEKFPSRTLLECQSVLYSVFVCVLSCITLCPF